MTEDELKALKDLPAPPPRAGAKAAAMAAAMAAFDAAEKKTADTPQGKEPAPRPTHASQPNGRPKMRVPILYRVAAGIAVIAVATPTAVYVLNDHPITGLDPQHQQSTAPAGAPENNQGKLAAGASDAEPAGEPAPAPSQRKSWNWDRPAVPAPATQASSPQGRAGVDRVAAKPAPTFNVRLRMVEMPRDDVSRLGIDKTFKVIDASGLEVNKAVTMLAEPTLEAAAGETASFIAGGEIPIPVPAPTSEDNNRITLHYQPVGLSLEVIPNALGGDRISLQVKSEFSFPANMSRCDGFNCPSFIVRRASSTAEIGTGQTLAMTFEFRKDASFERFPSIGELPVLGSLFQSDRYRRNETDLVVLITPDFANQASAQLAAQLPPVPPAPPAPKETIVTLPAFSESFTMPVGQGRVLRVDEPLESVFISDPSIADIRVVSADEIYLYGKKVGMAELTAISAATPSPEHAPGQTQSGQKLTATMSVRVVAAGEAPQIDSLAANDPDNVQLFYRRSLTADRQHAAVDAEKLQGYSAPTGNAPAGGFRFWPPGEVASSNNASPRPAQNAPADKLVYDRLSSTPPKTESPSSGPAPVVSAQKQDDQVPGVVTSSGSGTLEERINRALRDAKQEEAEPASPPRVAYAPQSQPAEPAPSGRAAVQARRQDAPDPSTAPTQTVRTAAGHANTETAPQQAPRAVKTEIVRPDAAQPEAKRLSQPEAEKSLPSSDFYAAPEQDEGRDRFEAPAPNPVKQVAKEPVSTFSIDVDTASYTFARRMLNAGRLPPKDSVRVEEMINYFPYDYPRPETAETPFQPTVTVVPSPWRPTNKLVHIGIKGYDVKAGKRPQANLVFLVDISGSMAPADRLPLVKNAFRMLVDELKPDDTVGIVTYASGSGIALEPTKVSKKGKILAAIDRLGAGGSTAGAAGINDAYRLAEQHFDKEGVNRIILATDGDFNVGISDQGELKRVIEKKRQSGVFLSILGVGQGNYQDSLMQTLAQNGNGTAAYVDTLSEARKVLVDEASSTLFTIAKDVKIQMEFNPAAVSEYRLIGYETRALAREDFNNDRIDAGEIGSGHTVTAIYEVTPVGAPKLVDDLRYAQAQKPAAEPVAPDPNAELGFLKLRYKLPNEDVSKLITVPVTRALEKADIAASPEDVRFSVAVAGYGQLLRGTAYIGADYTYDKVLALALTARGADPFGYRAEFLNLLRLAKSARP